MGYCSPKKHKDIQVYTKVHNNTVPEVREPKKRLNKTMNLSRIKLWNQIQRQLTFKKVRKNQIKQKNIPLIKDPFFLYHIIYNIWLKL